MVRKIRDETLAMLSKRLDGDCEKNLAPATNDFKLNCWVCNKYENEAEQCTKCSDCNLWTLKKIFLHNRRYLRYLEPNQLHKMGFST